MNQSKDSAQATHDNSKPQDSQYLVHRDASAEVKKWIEEAHQRLEYFAGQADQREAYERELMTILDHNTSVKQHHEDGYTEGKAEGKAEARASLLPISIQALRASGLSDEEIITKLELTEQESKTYLG